MSAVTDSDMRDMSAFRTPFAVAVQQISCYLAVIGTAFFVISTGVSPVIPWGVAFVATVAIFRILKRAVSLYFSEKKLSRLAS